MNETINWAPGVTLEAVEKEVILKAFRFFRANKTATANALGIAIRTLDNKLEKYELDGRNEKLRHDNAAAKRADLLIRQRGGVPVAASYPAAAASVAAAVASKAAMVTGPAHVANTGQRVEPAVEPAAKPNVSVPQRKEVQSVLPSAPSTGHSRKNR